jgi:hypothetical protein
MGGGFSVPVFLGWQFEVERAITSGFSLQLHGADGTVLLPGGSKVQMDGHPIDDGIEIGSGGGVLRYATHQGSSRLVVGLAGC